MIALRVRRQSLTRKRLQLRLRQIRLSSRSITLSRESRNSCATRECQILTLKPMAKCLKRPPMDGTR